MALAAALQSCGGGGTAPAGGPTPSGSPTPVPAGKIHHVVIIVQENRTPDDLFHGLAGADIANSGLDSHGNTVALQPVNLAAGYDLDHSHSGFLTEYNSGGMNGFDKEVLSCPSNNCNPLTAYGYVPPSQVQPYFQMAQTYTFADRMFQTNEGPSLPAHQYILSGTAESRPGSTLYVSENPDYFGKSHANCDGSPTGASVQLINIDTGNENTTALPCFDHPTLFDALDAKGLSYKYYASTLEGLWVAPDAVKGIRFGPDWSHVVGTNTAILNDIASNKLPAVSWVMPTAAASDHPQETDGTGPDWVASVVNAIGNSAYWQDTAIFVVWDDWGGWYDHARPQQFNAYELGFRVPLIVISPYARPGYVSHVQHEFGSILSFTEEQLGLQSLGFTDARADDLSDCFDYSQTPLTFRTIQSRHRASYFLRLPASAAPVDTDF